MRQSSDDDRLADDAARGEQADEGQRETLAKTA
jgi:hypothetical protein